MCSGELEKSARLATIKRAVCPDNLFHFHQNVKL